MNDLIDRALDAADRLGAAYADVRVVERSNEQLTVKNGALEAATSNVSAGFGVRVLVNGAWGLGTALALFLAGGARSRPEDGVKGPRARRV